MNIKLTGKFATIVDKILGYHQDSIGVFCWTPEDEQFLLDTEMNYFKNTGASIYETKDCPTHFNIDAINFRKRVKTEL